MIERLRDRYFRRTPQGRPDVVGTLRNVVGDPRSENELTPTAYLEGLGEKDRANVAGFVAFAATIGERLPGVRVDVTAVGSTTRPETQRHHPAEDIDLRILNSAPVNSEDRVAAVAAIQDAVRGHLTEQQVEFAEDTCTLSTRMVWGSSGGNKELLPFADWYNNDPSFTAKFADGLPLQISISGADNYDLDTYLQKDREHNGHFALLHKA